MPQSSVHLSYLCIHVVLILRRGGVEKAFFIVLVLIVAWNAGSLKRKGLYFCQWTRYYKVAFIHLQWACMVMHLQFWFIFIIWCLFLDVCILFLTICDNCVTVIRFILCQTLRISLFLLLLMDWCASLTLKVILVMITIWSQWVWAWNSIIVFEVILFTISHQIATWTWHASPYFYFITFIGQSLMLAWRISLFWYMLVVLIWFMTSEDFFFLPKVAFLDVICCSTYMGRCHHCR